MRGQTQPPPISSNLCKRCKILELDDKKLGGRIETSKSGERYVSFGSTERLFLDYELKDSFPELPQLSASASSGCAVCVNLKKKLVNFANDKGKGENDLFIYKACYWIRHETSYPDIKPWLEALWVFFKFEEDKYLQALRFEINAEPTDPCAQWLSIRRRPLAPNLLSDSGVQRLHELLEKALRDAAPEPSTSYLPTRLIDVGGQDGLEDPRLVISEKYPPLAAQNSISESRRYIALSYCWGPPEVAKLQLKTERESLEDRLQGIKLQTLPKTLQEAILVCRALRLRYIWIDALCIIQDDEADWEAEAKEMANVYSNSLLTICAVQGDSCMSGFLKRRIIPQVDIGFRSSLDTSISGKFSIFSAPYKYSWEDIDDESAAILVRDKVKRIKKDYEKLPFSFPISSYDPFDKDIKDSPWNSRGWTFQEASSSPRILLFGERMAHIFVKNSSDSEDGTHNPSNIQWGYSLSRSYEKSPNPEEAVLNDWRYLVREYSRRSLTYKTDVLPALSALAQHFSSKINGNYLAGIWDAELHHQLLWAHFGMRDLTKFLEPPSVADYTAPSWSWASQPDYVDWVWVFESTFEPEFELLGTETAVDGLNPYGRVKDGYLSLSAKICEIPSTKLSRGSVFFGFTFPYDLQSAAEECLAHLLFDWRHSGVLAPRDPETGEEREDGPIDRLSMVLISRKLTKPTWPRKQIWDEDVFLGLLLLPTDRPDEYRRAGLFFSEIGGPGGRAFWDPVKPKTLRLV